MKNLIFIIIATYSGVLSQNVPQAFNYQGIARDAKGQPYQSKTLSIRIILQERNEPTTTDLYIESHKITTNTFGLFNIIIGRGEKNYGTFENVNFLAKKILIKTEIDPEGGINYNMSSTSELLSVPYALVAGKTSNETPTNDTIWKFNKTDKTIYTNSDYKLSIGSGNSQSKLRIENSHFTYGVPDFEIHNTNLSDDHSCAQIKLYSGNKGFGEFGIGIYGNQNTNRLRNICFLNATNWGLNIGSSYEKGFLSFSTAGHGLEYEKMRLDSKGMFGIGTSNPAAKLHVSAGDIYIDNANNGIIMTSPNGQCWKVTIDNSGNFISTKISCPQ